MFELDETNIANIFNISDSLHKKALINAISIVKERGVKAPSNLWEFKVGLHMITSLMKIVIYCHQL